MRYFLILTTLIPFIGHTQNPSFDCDLAQSDVELVICSDVDLAAMDRWLGELYFSFHDSQRQDLLSDQRFWNQQRLNCLDFHDGIISTTIPCMEELYRYRLIELSRLREEADGLWPISGEYTGGVLHYDGKRGVYIIHASRNDGTGRIQRNSDGSETIYTVTSSCQLNSFALRTSNHLVIAFFDPFYSEIFGPDLGGYYWFDGRTQKDVLVMTINIDEQTLTFPESSDRDFDPICDNPEVSGLDQEWRYINHPDDYIFLPKLNSWTSMMRVQHEIRYDDE